METYKKITLIAFLLICGLLLTSCDNYLETSPRGALSSKQLNTPENINKILISAYAMLANGHWNGDDYISEWEFGDVRSDDAYKGGGGIADQLPVNKYEQFVFVRKDMFKADNMWFRLYVGVQRANTVLKRIEQIGESEFPKKMEKKAEARFLRGTFYFYLKRLFKHIPWITENVPADSIKNISNVQYTSQELWDKIAGDFKFAVKNLPTSQTDVGRPTKYAAEAFLARVRLYQAYVQNKNNQVMSINKDDLKKVVKWTTDVIKSGEYALYDDFRKNFLWKYDNGKESIFAVQYSLNDGTREGRINMEVALNYPMFDAYGCCWFHIPSQNLVNAFRTGKNGLPMFKRYNDIAEIKNYKASLQDFFKNNTFDPRLDHTVSIPQHIFKYDQDLIYDLTWTRATSVYGPYSGMKALQLPSCPCFTKSKGYPYPTSSKNWDILRYDMVLLWKAEALVELGREDEALPLINKIRMRAKHSKEKLRYSNGKYESNYDIEKYKPGINCTWTQDFARRAVHWEERLEFAMEGIRFFALVRWGVAAEVMNSYFKVEETRHSYLKDGHFTKGRDEYLPIPHAQIEFSDGLYQQNPGW